MAVKISKWLLLLLLLSLQPLLLSFTLLFLLPLPLSFFLLFTVDIIISSFAIVITFLAVVVAVMIVIAVVVAAVAVVVAIAVIVAAIVLLLPLLPFFVVATIAVVAIVSVIAVMSVVEKLIWAMQETKALVVSDRSFQHDASAAAWVVEGQDQDMQVMGAGQTLGTPFHTVLSTLSWLAFMVFIHSPLYVPGVQCSPLPDSSLQWPSGPVMSPEQL